MRYLKSRNEFLYKEVTIDKSTINEQIKSSKMISEAFENDIRWGDSLLGRLISSALRVTKIGYQQTKVPKLLDQLKGELDNIITQSFSRDINEKYHELSIKSFMEEMKNCCLSSQTDVDKLRLLLGWDGQTPLWNESDPKSAPQNSGAENFIDFERRRPLDGIMNRIFDDIEKDLPNLKEILGDSRDSLLDKLSDFTDELRKLTVNITTNQDSELRTFKKKFTTVLNGLAAVKDSYLFHSKYHHFVNEATEVDNSQEKNGLPSNKTEDNKNIEQNNPVVTSSQNDPVDTKSKQTTAVAVSNQKQIEMLKIKGQNLVNKISDDMKDEDIKKLPEYKEVYKIVSTLSQQSKDKIKSKDKDGHSILSTLGELFDIKNQQKVSVKENIKIFEELNQGDVENIWRETWGDWDKQAIHKLSQREVDELNKMMDEGESMKVVDLSKRPDPLIAISRIFKKAHDIYFVENIPSGRKGGMVSNTTMRQYIYCGSGSRPSADRAGEYGPWLIKSIWNQWNDGVMKIIEDQTYRKVLSKINFIIPGAEDSFNRGKKEGTNESTRFRINEAEVGRENIGTTGNKIDPRDKKSHGQILLDFMNDMLDQDQQSDFSKSRRNLLKQYFGVIDSNIKNEDRSGGRKEDKVAGKLLWENITLSFFKKDDDDKNYYYYFNLKEDARKVVESKATTPKSGIFLQVIQGHTSSDYVHIKFTMDQATAAHLLIKSNPEYKGFTMDTKVKEKQNFLTTPVKNVYYGLLKNEFKNGEISISYVNLKENDLTVQGEPKSNTKYNFRIDPQGIKILYKEKDGSKEKVEIPDDLRIINKGSENLDTSSLHTKNAALSTGGSKGNLKDKCEEAGRTWFKW